MLCFLSWLCLAEANVFTVSIPGVITDLQHCTCTCNIFCMQYFDGEIGGYLLSAWVSLISSFWVQVHAWCTWPHPFLAHSASCMQLCWICQVQCSWLAIKSSLAQSIKGRQLHYLWLQKYAGITIKAQECQMINAYITSLGNLMFKTKRFQIMIL